MYDIYFLPTGKASDTVDTISFLPLSSPLFYRIYTAKDMMLIIQKNTRMHIMKCDKDGEEYNKLSYYAPESPIIFLNTNQFKIELP